MGFWEVAKIILVPAFIAAALYLLLAYALVPMVRRHQGSYSRFLPAWFRGPSSSSSSSRRVSLRDRVSETFTAALLARRYSGAGTVGDFDTVDEDFAFGPEYGEPMVGFEVESRGDADAHRSEHGGGPLGLRMPDFGVFRSSNPDATPITPLQDLRSPGDVR